ncbi:MAG: oligosaccharide flippase family protein [Myxococcota bacterium]|nr:oligosaccharide flippase family protein [Myxococcota bacterium]MEC9389795.1 oligosaccharide flippase family protein [Myxococcota bacterium]
MESDPPAKPDTINADTAQIARGSAIVMAGGIGERAFRMVTTWFLSGALGVTGFGLYAFATTVVGIVGALAPLGMDAGITMYGARYRSTNETGRLRGTLMAALGTVALSAPAFSILTYLAIDQGWVLEDRPQEAAAVLTVCAAIGLSAVLAAAVAVLISAKDMVGQALSAQLAVPAATLVGAALAVGLGGGTTGVLMAFTAAYAVGAAVAIGRLIRQDGALLRDRSVRPTMELRGLFSYALPQSFARILYRANLWVDIVMLTALASLMDVGVYRVSVAIAMLGALPVMASTTMFGPVIAELIYSNQIERLNALLKVVTRWLIVLSVPLYAGVLLLPDVVLALFDDAYLTGAPALGVLMIGQAVYVACAPTGAILTNAGHSMLNLFNGVVSVGLNIGLNLWLIPNHGIMGAAIASATALSAWSIMRLVEVRHLHRCWPFTGRTLLTVTGVAVAAVGLQAITNDSSIVIRIGATTGAIAAGAGLFYRFGLSAADDVVIERLRAKFGRR